MLAVALCLLKIASCSLTSQFEHIFIDHCWNGNLNPIGTRAFYLVLLIRLRVFDEERLMVVPPAHIGLTAENIEDMRC